MGHNRGVGVSMRWLFTAATLMGLSTSMSVPAVAEAAVQTVGPFSVMKTCGTLWVGGYVTGKYSVSVNAAGHLETAYFYPLANRVDSQSAQHSGTVTVQASSTMSAWNGYCSNL